MRLLSAPAVSSMKAATDSTTTLRGDFAGGVAAHAVGDEEQTDVRTRGVAVFVAAAPEAGVSADGPGERERRHAEGQALVSLMRFNSPTRMPGTRDETWRRMMDFCSASRARS